jgi:hypothetical protein
MWSAPIANGSILPRAASRCRIFFALIGAVAELFRSASD